MTKAHFRTEYLRAALDEQDAGADPIALFERWFDEAARTDARDPNAMALATCDADGQPSVRTVLCKEFDRRGFVFFTNYESQKGRELAGNARAALLFFWPQLERQVRIGGTVARVPAAESDAYFALRPIEARIAAIASPQSAPVASREFLEQRIDALRQDLQQAGAPVRPAHWGGYRLAPVTIEFWQGRRSRLHDRLLFTLGDGQWQRVRLAP
jgi:pyridoxamine 5'-phosphate oxidase